jgi:hypothetical protein
MITTNLYSDSPFLLGYSAVLDLAFSIPKTDSITVWVSEQSVCPSRAELRALLPIVTEDTLLEFEVGRQPTLELSVDCLFLDSRGLVLDLHHGKPSISGDHVRGFELCSLVPLPSIDATLRGIAILNKYPALPVADEFRAWLRRTDRYLERISSRFPEVAVMRLRHLVT